MQRSYNLSMTSASRAQNSELPPCMQGHQHAPLDNAEEHAEGYGPHANDHGHAHGHAHDHDHHDHDHEGHDLAHSHAHGHEHVHAHAHGHAHHHGHGHTHSYRAKDRGLLAAAFAITVVMMVAEIVTGWFTHSLALISDGVHMFTHAFALGLSWAAIIVAARPASDHKTFGYYRIEVVAAFANGITVLLSAVWIVVEAVGRLITPEPVQLGATLAVAVLGLVINLITGAILLRADQENLNVRSAFLHMLTDALSSVAIIIGLVVIHFTQWHVIDPLIALVVAVVITRWSWSLLSESVHILMEGSPLDVEQIRHHVKAHFPEVEDFHDVHVWQISQRFNCLTAHVQVHREYSQDGPAVIARVAQSLKDKFGIGHTTLQLEWR
jgi:cobalt-zinc-cadmium efflux system protein